MLIPSSFPPLPPIPEGAQNPQDNLLNIDVHQEPDVVIQVEAEPDLDIGVETLIDVDENANLLKELETAIFQETGIDMTQTDSIDKRRIRDVSAHFEKEGTDAKSPMVVHTYATQKMKRVYNPATEKIEDKLVDVTCWKFKATWKIKVLEPDGQTIKTITRTAWMKTPIEVPQNMRDPKDMNHSQYLAMMHVKAVRHTYKAALDPLHFHHQRTQEMISFLRKNDTLKISFMPNPESWQLQLANLQKGHMAHYAVVKVRDGNESLRVLEIDYFKTAAKVDSTGKKWVNTASNIQRREYKTSQKYREQLIVCHDERLAEFEALKKTDPANFLQSFDDYQNSCNSKNPTYGLITAAYYKDLVESEAERKKAEFDATASHIAVQFAGHPALQMVEGLTGLVPNSLIEKNIEDRIAADIAAYNEEENPQMKQMKGIGIVTELGELCKAAAALQTIKNDIIKGRDQLETLVGDDSFTSDDLKPLNKTITEMEKKLAIYQPLIDIQPTLAGISSSLRPAG